MAENIKSRKYYRVHNGTDWDRMHFVTDANSVDANDGDTMETKVGAFKGITTSTNVTEEGYAADAKTVSELSDSLSKLYLLDYDNAVDLTTILTTEGATYTPPKSGVITCKMQASATNAIVYLMQHGVDIMFLNVREQYGRTSSQVIVNPEPVTLSQLLNAKYESFTFVPFK